MSGNKVLFTKMSPEKSFSRKCMGTKDVYNLAKKGVIGIKNTPGYIQYADADAEKVLFIKTSQT